MSTNAYLPCLVCNKVLPNVLRDCDNQPYGGTEFRTEGHYGSTFWDSFDGEELVLNVCDKCLQERSDRLGQRKSWLPVKVRRHGCPVGRMWVHRPLVAYTGNPDDSELLIDVEEVGTDLPHVEWVKDAVEIADADVKP